MKGRFIFNVDCCGIYSKKLNETAKNVELFHDKDKNNFGLVGRILKPFLNGNCIISTKFDFISLTVIKENFKPGETKIIPRIGQKTNRDYSTFNDNILILTRDSNLTLIKARLFGGKIKVKILHSTKIEGIKDRVEYGASLAVCNKGKIVLVAQRDVNRNSSSLSIYEIYKRRLIKKSVLDVKSLNIEEAYCLRFVKRVGNFVYFCSLSNTVKIKTFFTYCYDVANEVLRELSDMRKEVKLGFVSKFVDRTDGTFGGIDWGNNLFSVEYK